MTKGLESRYYMPKLKKKKKRDAKKVTNYIRISILDITILHTKCY